MPTRTEAIRNLLLAKTHDDLAAAYNIGMECQVNVAQDGGERIDGQYMGRKWVGWTDSLTTWKSFRIPYNAMSEPEYQDREMSFDLESHAEGIGLTGWDWVRRVSKWIAFDIDSILNHDAGHSTEDIARIIKASQEIPWVTIRKSTSGKGIHLYIYLADVPTANHNEHAALARAVLGKLSAKACYDFESKVDTCGGNMWVWHRKMQDTDGLSLIKQGGILAEVPENWRDHINVITNRATRIRHNRIVESGIETVGLFEELCGQRPRTPIDTEHKKLLDYLEEREKTWWWDNDNWLLVCHSKDLEEAHKELNLKGFYESLSSRSSTYNCFAFPMQSGAWSIRRYSRGVEEHPSWDQDAAGWTRTYLNRTPTFDSACRAFGGLEDPSGGYIFRDTESARQAAMLFGVHIQTGTPQNGRECTLKMHRDGRLIVNVRHESYDSGEQMSGWLQKKDMWVKIYNTTIPDPLEPEVTSYDDTVRHLVTMTGEDSGWVIKTSNQWKEEPLSHVKIALASLGLTGRDVQSILGSAIFRCWSLTNKPFQPEYPGNREWNRNAAQFRYTPTQEPKDTPHWDLVLRHCGENLDSAIRENTWCQVNGIVNGGDYLRCWVASLFQKPLEPLPYLFFYGPENSGKSIFHEALSKLLTKGYVKADQALVNPTGYNGELAGGILCVVEETDVSMARVAHNRIKDWVTARELSIHTKGMTPYHIPNSTHWVQTSNYHTSCPILPGDTRITMCYVGIMNPLDIIPKNQLLLALEEEAPDFLGSVLTLEIPESKDRLGIPIISTEDKGIIEQMNRSPLESFIGEKCQHRLGSWIKFSEFFERLQQWLDPEDFQKYTRIHVGRHMPPQYPKGRNRASAQFYFGNISWIDEVPDTEPTHRYILNDGMLDLVPIKDPKS